MQYLRKFNESNVDKDLIRSLCNQYFYTRSKGLAIVNPNIREIHDDGTVDIEGDIHSRGRLRDINFMPIKFGIVTGSFICPTMLSESGGFKVSNLNNFPRVVGGDFNVDGLGLTSLEGGPTEVGGSYFCKLNKLTNLVGAPKSVEHFLCPFNNLISLEGCPKIFRKESPKTWPFDSYSIDKKLLGGKTTLRIGNNLNLFDPTGLKDVQVDNVEFGWPLSEFENFFEDNKTRNFIQSLDYNYFRWVRGKPSIIIWRFLEALDELGCKSDYSPNQLKRKLSMYNLIEEN